MYTCARAHTHEGKQTFYFVEQLMRILGDNEPNPSNPPKYKSYYEIKNDSNFKNYGQT